MRLGGRWTRLTCTSFHYRCMSCHDFFEFIEVKGEDYGGNGYTEMVTDVCERM